jgi:glycosyltransferase involved in cell wall biosynthesis
MIQNLLITVFIPVYNGEKYLNSTLLSIMNQSYSNFEVLLLDDSSIDKSLSILKKFAEKDDRFKVLSKINGGMVSVAWNFIMPHIKGQYVFYSSQDDIFSTDLIEKMVNKQKETSADTILPDMEYYYENRNKNKRTVGLNGNRNIDLTGRKAFVESLNWNIHGFALFRSTLVTEEVFPEDAFDSDDLITRKLFLKSNKVVFCEGVFYYRQDNSQAITKTFSKKNFYSLNSAYKLYTLLNENNFDKNLIINVQFSILLRFLQLTSIATHYGFDSNNDKHDIDTFLIDFKKKYLTTSFYFSNLYHATKELKIRFIILVFVCKNDFLFKKSTILYSKYNNKIN